VGRVDGAERVAAANGAPVRRRTVAFDGSGTAREDARERPTRTAGRAVLGARRHEGTGPID